MAAFALSQAAPRTQQVLFEKALALEEAQAKLPEAIALYQKIVVGSDDESLAARAQLRIGICQQKLGRKEAQSAFQKVIDNYPDQLETVRLAREQLSRLQRAAELVERGDRQPAIRLIWSGPGADISGAPSSDGEHLCFTDWSTGDLAVRDLDSGKNRRLTDKGPWEQSSEEADSCLWSPDGTQIAYEWETDGNRRLELRVVGLRGSGPRTLYRTAQDEWATLYDWSPDGKHILALLPGNQLSLISLADGSTTALKSLDRDSTRAQFSPDGQYVVFDAPQTGDPLRRDIYTLSIADRREMPLVVHAADDHVLGWAPDGQAVLFGSDRTGSQAFWAIPVADGKAQGSAQMIRPVSSRTVPLGFSRDGRFFFGESHRAVDVYGTRLDTATGRVLEPPRKLIDQFEGFNLSPSYSPDGKRLAYCSWRGSYRSAWGGPVGMLGNVLCVRSTATGEEREFSKALRALEITSITGPRWAPDGTSILVYGWARETGGHGGDYVVDLQRGVATEVVYSSKDVPVSHAEWLSDGKTIVFFRCDKKKGVCSLVARNLDTGDERVVRQFPESANPGLAISPDYQRLCISAAEGGGRVFWILNPAGGEPRRLQGVAGGVYGFTWAADGRHILNARRAAEAGFELWRVSIDGGEPELLGSLSGSSSTVMVVSHLSASPDGKRIAFSRAQLGGAEVWVMENPPLPMK
ncbi:MAG: tetratricopeptide repeat protein [Acidobacteriota bacterium]